MKRTVLFAAALAFVLGMGFSFAAPTAVMAAEGKKESPCAKLTDKKQKAACVKKEADAKKAKK